MWQKIKSFIRRFKSNEDPKVALLRTRIASGEILPENLTEEDFDKVFKTELEESTRRLNRRVSFNGSMRK